MISFIILSFFLFKKDDKVSSYIYALSMWMLICFWLTEILSLFNAISCTKLWISWLVCDVLLLVCNMVKYRKKGDNWNFLGNYYISKGFMIWLIFALTMLFFAVKTVPYNFDSMTYHMPRLFHWAQNESVNYYATAIDRQIGSPIGAAYVNLHVYVMMNQNDRFVNLLQCCSFLTNGLLAYAITKKLGCISKYCMMAMILFYTMPIAFAEAFSTQVDNFSALWMLATIYLLLDLLKSEERMELNRDTFMRVCGLSLCVSFGYLTKPSIGIGLLFFAIWLLTVVIRRRDKVGIIAIYILIAAVILACLLIPGIWRNFATFDAISAPNVGKRQLIGTLAPLQVLVNFVKNFTFNMPTVWIYRGTDIIYDLVTGFSALLRVDIDNPAISEDGVAFRVYDPQVYSHDRAINPVIIYALILCVILWLVKNRKKYSKDIRNGFFIVAVLSFIAFCAMLRWEQFVSRYMISYLAILCPACVGQFELAFENTNSKRAREMGLSIVAIVYFLCITEFWGLVCYHGEIAVSNSRYAGYFRSNGYVEDGYREVAEFVNKQGYDNIGLLFGGNTYEYPLTTMLEDYNRIEHVNVTNKTAVYEDLSFIPDIIIAIDYPMEEDLVSCHGEEYEVVKIVDGNYCLLERVE